MTPFASYPQTRSDASRLLQQSLTSNPNAELYDSSLPWSLQGHKEACFIVGSDFTVGFDRPINIVDEGSRQQALN